jgi:hypothetical protein
VLFWQGIDSWQKGSSQQQFVIDQLFSAATKAEINEISPSYSSQSYIEGVKVYICL